MKRMISILLISVLLLGMLPMAMAATVLSTQKLTVDGKAVDCEKYNIDGANYFKLRDIAYLLSGTQAQFSVTWDAESRTVSIRTNESYTPDGSELDLSGGDKSATAKPSKQTLKIDGKIVTGLSVYNIGGNNYFKLRDLGDALGFTVGYDEATRTATVTSEKAFSSPVKLGLICLQDESSAYDLNFIKAAMEACDKMGIEYVLKVGIPESQECYDAAMDLVDEGCNIVFANSFGHEDYMIQAAKKCPNVQFCHATGTKAHTERLANYHNAYASIYEGRYLTGVAAGMKLKERIANGYNQKKVGFVGTYTYAEVISAYTAFFLGVRSIVPDATMEVTFTGSWSDRALETECAQYLIDDGCVLISQYAESVAVPSVCEAAGVLNISYNGTSAAGPNTFIVSSRINWTPYFEYIIAQVQQGNAIDTDWVGTLKSGSVVLSDINNAVAAAGTAEAIEKAKNSIISGALHVFDISTFSANGEVVKSYFADVNYDTYYTGDTEAIVGGYFHESEFRSAPYFDLTIDGITLLNTKF